MLNASLNSERIAKDPFKLHIWHILSSMETTTTSVQKIWIFHWWKGDFWLRSFVCMIMEKRLFLLRRFDPFSGIVPSRCRISGPAPRPTSSLEGHILHAGQWLRGYLAQNLSSMADPTGSYAAASTAFRSPLRYSSSFIVLNINITCLHILHRRPLGSN
jgi:hypothetical protein